jgi:two-component system LytT family response regulator
MSERSGSRALRADRAAAPRAPHAAHTSVAPSVPDDSPLRVLIVDDEPLARTQLRELLTDQPGVEIIGECGSGAEAVTRIVRDDPDLVLLDIQMPEIDGFGVVRAVGRERMPAVIFVTASDAHAVRAFDVHAADYVLKPVDRGRLLEAIDRAKTHIGRTPEHEEDRSMRTRLTALVAEVTAAVTGASGGERPGAARLAVKRDDRVTFVRTADVDWIEAMDNYVRLHVGRQTHVMRGTLSHLEARLPTASFLRIHRSTIVNVDRVQEVQPWFAGDYVLILSDRTQLTTGRRYRAAVRDLLGRSA